MNARRHPCHLWRWRSTGRKNVSGRQRPGDGATEDPWRASQPICAMTAPACFADEGKQTVHSQSIGNDHERWSGRPDLNWGPLGPEPSALPGYATPRITHASWRVASEKQESTLPARLVTRHSAYLNKSLVGTAGFEPATPCTPSKCATRLRYVPEIRVFTLNDG